MKRGNKSGFSLVELSIVLVVIGLLLATVVVGQNIIEASKYRATISQLHEWGRAIMQFNNQYRYYPGDLPNAYQFWGVAAGCANASVYSNGNGCNGDGNGRIMQQPNSTCGSYPEAYEVFEMLYRAGYSKWKPVCSRGANVPGACGGVNWGTSYSVADINLPKTPLPNQNPRTVFWPSHCIGDNGTVQHGGFRKASIMITAENYGVGPYYVGPGLTPRQAYRIDQKIDDGRPNSGNFVSLTFLVTGGSGTCVSGGAYNFSNGDNLACTSAYFGTFSLPAF